MMEAMSVLKALLDRGRVLRFRATGDLYMVEVDAPSYAGEGWGQTIEGALIDLTVELARMREEEEY